MKKIAFILLSIVVLVSIYLLFDKWFFLFIHFNGFTWDNSYFNIKNNLSINKTKYTLLSKQLILIDKALESFL